MILKNTLNPLMDADCNILLKEYINSCQLHIAQRYSNNEGKGVRSSFCTVIKWPYHTDLILNILLSTEIYIPMLLEK